MGPTIFECSGAPGVIEHIVDRAPRHSHVVVVGVCHDPISFVPAIAVAKELALEFVLAYRPSDLRDSLRRIADDPGRVTAMITATVGLEQSPIAIDALRGGSHGKILVLPQADEHASHAALQDP